MKYSVCILLLFLINCFSTYSQQKPIEHTVKQGESIYKIAKQYNLKPNAILELNPEAKNGLKTNSILKIPSTGNYTTTESPEIVHEVLPKETLYSICKRYNVSVEDIFKVNPKLEKGGLIINQKIKIPSTFNTTQKDKSKIADGKISSEGGIIHEVLQKETKYTIAKQHRIPIALLDYANPILKTEGLKAGQKISIPVKEYKVPQLDVTIDNQQAIPISGIDNIIKDKETQSEIEKKLNSDVNNSIIKEVKPKDTKWAISKEFRITVAALEAANPFLVNNDLKVGQKLTIPNQKIDSKNTVSIENNNSSVNQDKVEIPKAIEEIRTHLVTAKETKYGIAKEFGISITELEIQNPKIANKLLIGEIISIKTTKNEIPEEQKQAVVENINSSSVIRDTNFIDQLISTASENIGIRYRSGGTSKEGFDCSGLMCCTFGTFDIQLPRTSLEQSQLGFVVDTDSAQKGDLIFFKTSSRGKINHVGMVVEVSEGDVKFIHAASSGVVISSIKEKYYTKRLVQINRVL